MDQPMGGRTAAPIAPLCGYRAPRNVRIPMSDGVTLAADLLLPELPEPFPVIFDLFPYRKGDNSAVNLGYHYFAERGIAVAHVDVRGTGDSGGTALDEYCPQEQQDGVEAIAWLAAQPWCNGKVGMLGSSYTGFNSLQVAMHRPPALKAIAPMYFTDRRYTDDCHYKGGAMQMLYDVGTYGLSMVARNLLPPRLDLVGADWEAIWEEHLQNEPWLLRWIEHQTEDQQWSQGSLCEDYGAIRCATFLIGGWRDGYPNCPLRTYQHLTCPKKLIVGPWMHISPRNGVPGPTINHLREIWRFFAHWLNGTDTGIMDEPPIAIYVQRYDPPRADRAMTSGHWRYEAEWPLTRGGELTFHLGPGMLRDDSPAEQPAVDAFDYDPTVGSTFGMWSGGAPYVLPADQRVEEALSAVYTTAPLDKPVEILGHPRAVLHVESTVEVATFVARLCDVAPDDHSALVTKGVLNATHRASHVEPTPLVPGEVYELAIDLDATSWVFEPGHRIRLSVSNADFPNVWPSPAPATSRVHHGAARPSRLVLPSAGREVRAHPVPSFEPGAAPTSSRGAYRVTRDLLNGQIELDVGGSSTTRVLDGGLRLETQSEATLIVAEREPARATVRGLQRYRYTWPGRTIETRCRGQLESDAAAFHLAIHAEISVDGLPHFARRWLKSVPRHLL
jgi:putative CocE/NonD family hydrolase